MSMQPTKLYLRVDGSNGKFYITRHEDEDMSTDKLKLRRYDTYEELKKMHNTRSKTTTESFVIVDETDIKFREKWVPFRKDRVDGWQKGGRVLTKEMFELLEVDCPKDLNILTDKQKDHYYKLIACKVMRNMKVCDCKFTLVAHTDPNYMICTNCGKLFSNKELEESRLKEIDEWGKNHPNWMKRE
jgi:hypothetical protein